MLNKNQEPALLFKSQPDRETLEPFLSKNLVCELMSFAGTGNIHAIDLLLEELSPQHQDLIWRLTEEILQHPKEENTPTFTPSMEIPLHSEEFPISVFGSNLSLMMEEILYYLKKMPSYTQDSLNIARSEIFDLIRERKAEIQETSVEEIELTSSEEAIVHKVVQFFARQVLTYKKSSEEATKVFTPEPNTKSPMQ
jgi:hypothetical protein